MEKLVIIPTYNEKENIRAIVEAVFSLNEAFHVLVIDDGSDDPSGVADVVGNFPGVALHRQNRRGGFGRTKFRSRHGAR